MSEMMQRASLLLQQNRPADAEREARMSLAQDPNDARAHSVLAECLRQLGRLGEAHQEATAAVVLSPDDSLAHYQVARVELDRNRFTQALAAIGRAIDLDSEDPDHFSLRANIYLAMERWQDALNSADDALSIDPEHTHATSVRSLAQIQLGRQQEAVNTIGGALQRDPENSLTHAAHGWSMLHRGQAQKAIEHFREALRLEPTNTYAQQGLVEAIKATNPVYRWILAYFLWTSRLSKQARWGLVLGLWFGQRLLRSVAETNPQTKPIAMVVGVLYLLFVAITWLAMPLSNVLLRLHPMGKYALSREQLVASNAVGAMLLVSLLWTAAAAVAGEIVLLFPAAMFFSLMLSVSPVMECEKGWPRWTSLGIAVALVGGAAMSSLCAVGSVWATGESQEALKALMLMIGVPVLIGIGLSTFANGYLGGVRPER